MSARHGGPRSSGSRPASSIGALGQTQPPLAQQQPPPCSTAPVSGLDELFLNPLLWKAAGLRGPIPMHALREDPSLQPFNFEARVGWFPGEAQAVTISPAPSGKERHDRQHEASTSHNGRYGSYSAYEPPVPSSSRDNGRNHHASSAGGLEGTGARDRAHNHQYHQYQHSTAGGHDPPATSVPPGLAPPPPPIAPAPPALRQPLPSFPLPQQPADTALHLQQPQPLLLSETSVGGASGAAAPAAVPAPFPAFLQQAPRRRRSVSRTPRGRCSAAKLCERVAFLLQEPAGAQGASVVPETLHAPADTPCSQAAPQAPTLIPTVPPLMAQPSPAAQPAPLINFDIASLLQQAQQAGLVAAAQQPTLPAVISAGGSSSSAEPPHTPLVSSTSLPHHHHPQVLTAAGGGQSRKRRNDGSRCDAAPHPPSLHPVVVTTSVLPATAVTPRPSDFGCSRGVCGAPMQGTSLKSKGSLQGGPAVVTCVGPPVSTSCPPTSSDTSSQHGFLPPGLSASGSVDSQLDLLHPPHASGGGGVHAAKATPLAPGGSKPAAAASPSSPLSLHED